MDPVLAKILWASFLGVAVGAALGVLFAAAGKRRDTEARTAYLRSFRYVLEGDPDAAIEALALSGSSGSSAIATGVALGALFRKRGDWSRAIRIHEALLRSPSLSPAWKKTLALELGMDFRGAGMVSQAVEVLEGLVARDPSHQEALLLLRQMSEESGEWEKALDYHEAWERVAGPSPSVRCHLLVARARAMLREGRTEGLEPILARARACEPNSLDLRLLEAEIAAARGEGEKALALTASLVDERPALVFRALPIVEEVAHAEVVDFLEARVERAPRDRFLLLALGKRHMEEGRRDQAAELLWRLLDEAPSLIEARQALGRILLEGGDTQTLRTHFGSLLLDAGRGRRLFSCKRCEVELAEFWFRCPRCSAWDTIDEAARTEQNVVSRPHEAERAAPTKTG